MRSAIILTTGDRIDFLDQSIKCCERLLQDYKEDIEIDLYLVSFYFQYVDEKINTIFFDRPDEKNIDSFPKSVQQQNNFSNDLELSRRISLGHYILYGGIPNAIFENYSFFKNYDVILKSRADLIFDYDREKVKSFDAETQILTFECFWGGCRYNSNFTNDHFIFGKSEDVLKIISYKKEDCILDKFWNPEQYTTYLYNKVGKNKIEMVTDKYYLLSSDRNSRKFIGYPKMEKINQKDIKFLSEMSLDIENLKFENEYE